MFMGSKILIIEDEPSIADNICYALETEGYKIACFATGKEGLDALDNQKFDLIILDVGLPDISGFELCKKIRQNHGIPIVFLTARADEVDRVVGLEIGADDYMVKPFSPRELTARIKAILRRTKNVTNQQETQTAHSSIPFEVDEKKCLIRYYQQTLELSRYEYQLLLVFIKRPGQVFSRDQLMQLVWDDPAASMDRTVDAHIKSIRSKLKNIKADIDAIQTHRGMGYSLKEQY